jgi:hypothetical protein
VASEFGFEAIPHSIKSDSHTMKWLTSRSYRYKAIRALNSFYYGLSDMSFITPKQYKNLLELSGEDKEEAAVRAAKLYLKRQENNAQ